MARTTLPPLAKLTRPQWFDALPRERLFAVLDARRSRRKAICVVGPPGAGKTTLVATWLGARGIRGIWLQVDPGDADLPTFFYYLGRAADAFARKGAAPLPLLTPEYLPDVPGFARRFFRELYGRLPAGAALVLDNYQEVSAENIFHALMADAVEAAPPGITVVVVSRRDPPECYARLMASEHVGFVDWKELALTEQEATAIARQRGLEDAGLARQLAQRSGGWAAGLTLMLERLERTGSAEASGVPDALDDVFRYFAAQIFGGLPAGDRRILVALGFPPRITPAMAEALAQNPRASALLETLYRRHLFTDRRRTEDAASHVYQFHALFRDFLRHQAQALFSAQERAGTAARAAHLCESAGQAEDAFDLYRDAAAWEDAARLVLRNAATLIAQGRWAVVTQWAAQIPAAIATEDRWLQYWAGTAYIRTDQQKARAHLSRALELAQAVSDTRCRILADAGMIFSMHFESLDYSLIDASIERLGVLLEPGGTLDDPADNLFAQAALLLGIARRQPGHPRRERAIENTVAAFADGRIPLSIRATASHALMIVAQYGVRRSLGDSVIGLSREFWDELGLAPIQKSLLLAAIGCYHHFLYRPTEAMVALEEATDIARRYKAAYPLFVSLTLESFVLGLAYANDSIAGHPARSVQRADANWAELERVVSGDARFSKDYHYGSLLWRASLKGHWDEAERCGIDALAAAEAHGLVSTVNFWSIVTAGALVKLGDHARAQACIERGLSAILETLLAPWECNYRLLESRIAAREGDAEARVRRLREALSLARRFDATCVFFLVVSWLPEAMAEALNDAIEPDVARAAIAQFGVLPPGDDVPGWPYAAEISVLGEFELRRDGVRVPFAGKPPRQALALLKALLCLGGKEGVSAERLADALWPESEADAARRALKTTLHRLRDLLGDASLVSMDNGVVRLDRGRCWVDLWAFGAAVSRARGAAPSAVGEDRACALYRGPALPADLSAPWTVSLRERLRGQFNEHVLSRGAALEQAGRWEDAAGWYRTGIERDDLLEAFYQGWMRCLLARGLDAEAAAVLARLRRTLSAKLAVLPSPATLELMQGPAPRT